MMRLVLILIVCLLIVPDRSEQPKSDFIIRETTAPAMMVVASTIPTEEQFAELAKTDPVECFRAAVARYHRDFPVGYTVIMRKQERINSRLNQPESVEVTYRNEPQSVFMKWMTDPAGQADRVLYVAGANDNQIVCRPKSRIARAVAGSAVAVDPYGKEAKGGGRVAVPDSGLIKTTEHLVVAWSKAKEEGRLHFEYLGVETVEELDGRKCHMFRRDVDPPEAEGIKTVSIGLDTETWLPLVNVLKDAKGKLIGSYHFKDLKPVQEFEEGTFDKAALSK